MFAKLRLVKLIITELSMFGFVHSIHGWSNQEFSKTALFTWRSKMLLILIFIIQGLYYYTTKVDKSLTTILYLHWKETIIAG